MMMDDAFHTTRWTRVLTAKSDEPEAQKALSELCEIYYAPVHRFIQHSTRERTDWAALDTTHAFFESLLRGGINNVEPQLGRFRSYLLGAVKHFLSDQFKRDRAQKRTPQTDSTLTPSSESPPQQDAYFDREWALALLDRALNQLAKDHDASGKRRQFEVLKPWLSGDSVDTSQAKAAEKLGLTEGAVKVAIHRLRKQLRQLVKDEISQTVATEAEIAEELSYLIEALG